MDFALLLVLFLVDLAASTAFLWVGMKAASLVAGMPGGGQYCGYLDLVMVAFASSLAALVPYIGWALSFVVMYYMLRRVTEAEFRELWIMIVVSRIAAIFAVAFLGAAL